jgi:uncharacterized protein (TIGR02145 family)
MSDVLDYDGNSYSTVTINSVEWLSTNLKTTHLSSGTAIKLCDGQNFLNSKDGLEPNFVEWYRGDTPMYRYMNDDPATKSVYGLLYNYAAVATGLLRPSSACHVATKTEWDDLVTYYVTAALAGAALKGTGTTYWYTPNTGATNSSGFTALPTGYFDDGGGYYNRGISAYFWTATPYTTRYLDRKSAYYACLNNASASLIVDLPALGSFGYSVRCINDT